MKNPLIAIEASHSATPTTRITRDRQGLLDALTVHDSECSTADPRPCCWSVSARQVFRQLDVDADVRSSPPHGGPLHPETGAGAVQPRRVPQHVPQREPVRRCSRASGTNPARP